MNQIKHDKRVSNFGVWGLGFGVWGLGFGVWGYVVIPLFALEIVSKPQTPKPKTPNPKPQTQKPQIF